MRALVGADVRHESAASPSPATSSRSESTSSAQANVWYARLTSISRTLTMRSMSSSSSARCRRGARRRRRRAWPCPCCSDRDAQRCSMRSVSSSVVGCSNGDVARREPHLLVPALRAVTGFVAGMGFVEPAIEMVHRGASHVLHEAALEIGDHRVADHRAEPLHRPDAGEGVDDGPSTPCSMRKRAWATLGYGAARCRARRRGAGSRTAGVLLLPCVDGRPPVCRSGRDVACRRRRSHRGNAHRRRRGVPRRAGW